jgi:hypothetical protein
VRYEPSILFFYGAALAACIAVLTAMAFAEYQGVNVPPAAMCLAMAALAGILMGDWLVQNRIKRQSMDEN